MKRTMSWAAAALFAVAPFTANAATVLYDEANGINDVTLPQIAASDTYIITGTAKRKNTNADFDELYLSIADGFYIESATLTITNPSHTANVWIMYNDNGAVKNYMNPAAATTAPGIDLLDTTTLNNSGAALGEMQAGSHKFNIGGAVNFETVEYEVSLVAKAVPEPATLALVSLGALCLVPRKRD